MFLLLHLETLENNLTKKNNLHVNLGTFYFELSHDLKMQKMTVVNDINLLNRFRFRVSACDFETGNFGNLFS